MKKILFCGGGSAGHVIPNLAIMEELDGVETLYLGTDGIEQSICKRNGIPFYPCTAVKVVRGKIFCNLLLPFKLFRSIKDAGKILDELKPDLLFCKGGYVCVPPALAAHKRHIPIITHESDISPGLANRFIAGKCEKILTTFPAAAQQFKNGICTGSPMRKNLFGKNRSEARKKFGLDMRPTIIVLGGGSGSVKINTHVRNIAPKLCKDFNLLHVCGTGNAVDRDIYGYRQIEFADDMGSVYACADVALSRCGSNTANELIALKIPSLFIPLENKRTRGDQIANAEYFHAKELCTVLRESDLTDDSLLQSIYRLMHDDKIKSALSGSTVKCGNANIIKEIKATLQRGS